MQAQSPSAPAVVLDDATLRRLDVPGPRYTSYPTADRFVEAFDAQAYRTALRERAAGARVGGAPPLSLYVHIPFCESVCYYCACNKVITRHHERAAEYLDALDAEIALHRAELGQGKPATQVHFGGGTPTFLTDDELQRVMASLRAAFGNDYGLVVETAPDAGTKVIMRVPKFRAGVRA